MTDQMLDYIRKSNKRFFKKHQKILLQLINTPELRKIMGIDDPRMIVEVFPSGWSFLDKIEADDSVILTGHFFCYEKAAKFLGPIITRTPWFTTIKWAGGSAPTLTTTANKRDVFGFIVTGSGTYDGFVVGANI